ncbi:MAG: FadR/GntR family transcriptional regulator, partial [Chloroflexota bacterium]
MQLQPARTRLYKQIVIQLQQDILSGRLAPGHRLPAERDLATQYGVSRASVREALSALESRGFIQSRQGGGTIVRPMAGGALGDPLGSLLSSSGSAIRDPLEVRYIFEPHTTYLAAERATEAEIEAMSELLRTQETAIAAGSASLDQDTAFHFAIARASHNNLIVTIVGHINEALRETREWSLRAKGGAANSLRHHHRILAAIATHDAAAAQAAMAEHLKDV